MVYLFLIFLVEIILFYTNYLPLTYLIGWDNIMPEFNIFLNLKRSIFSVWQEYRGLGLLDGMSHASNLFHTLYIAFLSIFLPLNLLRWNFIFLTHLLGGIGFFYLAKKLFKNEKSAFLGALFYMFNLGIIQMYSAPLEVFAAHFASFPWLTLTIINFLEKPTKKNYFILFFVSLLTTPQSFVPTVFIAFFILFLFILFFDYLKSRNFKNLLIAFLIVIITNLFWLLPFIYSTKNNAKIIQNSRINQYSSERIYLRNKAYGDLKNIIVFKGFMMDTREFFPKENNNRSIMTKWTEYSKNRLFFLSYGLFFAITIIGILKIIKEKNLQLFPFLSAFLISFSFLANNTFILDELNNFFRSTFPVLGEAFRFPFTKFITLFAFSYTIVFVFGIETIFNRLKKIQNLIFILLILIFLYISLPSFQGYFISPLMKQKIPQEYLEIIDFFKKTDGNKRIAFLPTPSFWNWEYRKWGHVGSGFLWYGIPQSILLRAFDPWSHYNEQFYNEISYAQKLEDINLFNAVLKKYNIDYLLLDTSIINNLTPKPINYEKIINFLAKNNSLEKIKEKGYLKVYKFNSNNNGNFISIIENPVNVLKKSNFYYIDNTFLEEGNYILNEKNPERIEIFPDLFSERKQEEQNFNISINDEFIVFGPKNNLFKNLKRSENFKLIIPTLFNSYLIPAKIIKENNQLFVKILTPNILIDNLKYSERDLLIPLSTKIKNPTEFYLTETDQNFSLNQTFYLFRDYPNNLRITDENKNIELSKIDLKNINFQNELFNIIIGPKSTIKILIPKIKSIFTYENLIKEKKYLITGEKQYINEEEDKVNIKTKKKLEILFNLENLPHQNGYLILIKNHWKYGLPLDFYVDNYYQKRADLEGKLAKKKGFLNYFILPPTENFFNGYSFHIIADPIAEYYIENTIEDFSIMPINYEFLNQIKLEKLDFKNRIKKAKIEDFHAKKLNYFLYEVSFSPSTIKQFNNPTIYLSQSYHPGWKAYLINHQTSNINHLLIRLFPFIFGKELKNHVIVNNWANGWQISSNIKQLTTNTNDNQVLDVRSLVLVIFWPQYLQFLGFLILVLGLIFIFLINK